MRKIVTLLFPALTFMFSLNIVNAQTPPYFKGTGTSTNTIPMNTAGSHCQQIYEPGDFNTLPISGNITKIYFRNSTANGTGTYTNFSVAFLQNSLTEFPNTTFLTGFTNALTSSSITINGNSTAGGWYEIALATPFLYDNTKSLIVEIKYTAKTGGMSGYTTTATGNKRLSIITAPGAATGNLSTLWGDFGMEVLPSGPCTSPPIAGTATSTVTNVCSGTNFNLGLTGNSTGSGQTYQWQRSTTGVAPWTNIGVSSNTTTLTTSQTSTSFYRCLATCSSVSDTSSIVQVTSPALISGNFTINSGLPTGGGNFQTFTDAINYIRCGINGPVTFNVEVGSGPYTEQITIPQVFGANAANRITIQGNGSIIQFDPVTANRHVIKLDGADYVTIDSLDIRTTGNTTSSFGWGIHLTNGADYDSIKNCNITIGSLSTTQSNSAGIVASGSSTSVTTAGSASNNVFVGNTISGAYQAIILSGTATSLNGVKNQIIRNTIKDFYADGISITNNDSTVIAYNDISRPTRVTVTTFSGIELGAGNIKCIVEGNKIHDTHNAASSQTGTAYGIYSNSNDAPLDSANRVINNLIYNFNSGSGTIYGIYNSGSDGVRYYHNTIVLDNAASTGGITRGFFQTTAAVNIDFRNNLVYISRGGNGIKYCVFYGTTTSAITSNNNVLYNISSAGTNGIGTFGTTGSSDLTAWKSANSGAYDQQSVSVDPLFTDMNLQDYTPTETTVENIGANVGVSKDINGLSRILAAPDPGAFEVPASVGTDLRVEQLASPAISTKGCYNTENIVVTIRNNAATTLNFATTNATVTVTVAGVVNTVYTATINTGTLASGAALNVSVFAPSSTIDMSGLGNYNFTVTVDVTGDVNPSNNTINVDRAKLSLTGGTITATPETYCAVGGTPKLTSTDAEGYNSVKWQQSINGGVSYTDITNSDTLIYTLTTPIGQNTYFRMVAVCGSNEQNSTEDSVIINNPQILTSQGATRCGPGSLTLNATAAPGATIKWYATTTSTTELGNGGTFVTPTILNTTTYYVAAGEGGSNLSTGIANAISTTGNTGFSDIGLMFDASVPFTIQSVAIYPIGTGGAGTVTIELRNSANTVLQSFVANVTTAAAPGVKTVVPINFNVPVGIGHRLVVNGVTGVTSLIRESTLANFTYPYTVPGVMSITSAFTGGASSSFYYYFYDWQITAGCEGTRTPVVATITAPPTITASTLDTITCNGANASLVVNTANTNYTFSWTPGAQTNDTIIVSPTTTTKYYVNATDAGTGCTAIDSVTVWVQPVSTIDASPASFCVTGDTSILRLSPLTGYAPNTIQWQTSSNNVTYTDIPGATASTYITPVNNATTYYKAIIKNGAGLVCSDSVQRISVNNPLITGTTPATRCGPGSVTLNATAASTATIKWYENTTSTSALATGSSFVTPTILNTTTYYVTASEGSTTGFVGKKSPGTATNLLASPRGIQFDAVKAFVLESVKVYSTSATAGSGTITLLNASGNTVGSPVNVTWPGGGTAAAPIAHTLDLNLNVPQGNGYRLMMTSFATGGIAYETTGMTPAAYTALSNSNITFVGSMTSLTALSTSTYYYFYDWSITTDCESARTPVIATITATTGISASTLDSVVCSGANATLSVASSNTNYTYSWTPAALNGSSIVVNPTQTTKYYVNASDASTGCTAIDSVTVRVQPQPTINTNNEQFCIVGGTATLTLNPLTGYAANTIQWQSSINNVSFTDIPGAISPIYVTPTITTTTYYKVLVKNGVGGICNESTKTITLNNPTIISTTPATRCGTGTVDLSATANAGSTVNWYTTATGGTPLFTGNTFTTPNISTNTNYYAAASSGGGGAVNIPSPIIGTSTFITTTSGWGLRFTVNSPTTINSITIRASATTTGTANIQIRVTDLNDVILFSGNAHSFSIGTSLADYVIPVNINVPNGNYKMVMTYSGITTMVRESSGLNFPYTSPGNEISITAGANGAGSAQTTAAYYWFYNWVISTGCESARTLVTATVDNTPGCNALPVGLINFTGIKEGNINRLTWTTTTETNNAGFAIERSADGRSFSTLSFVTSKAENGNSATNINYNFNDTKILSGNNYYRLKQVDKDNKSTYSSIVLIKGEKVRSIMITGLYPNPATSEVKLSVESPSAEKVTIIVADVTGKAVLQTSHNLIVGSNTIQLPTANLANGNYFVKMICANGCETSTTKFVKQ